MKHSLFFSLALLLSLCSCNSRICTINGIAENPIFTSDGKYMVLLDHEENTIDSCYVEDGKFVLSCKRTDKFQYAVIVKDPKNGLDLASFIPVIPDISQLDIDFDQHRILTEESISFDYLAFQQNIMDAFMDKEGKAMGFINDGNKAAADSVNAVFHKWMKDTCTEKYLANLDNPIGQQAFTLLLREITPEEAIELYEKGGQATKVDSYISGTISAMKSELEPPATNTLLVVNADGSFVETEGSLDDYLGKGQPVLVDFWASWCGPCKEEIPNVVKVYTDYKDKGLIVIGVIVNDEVDNSKSVMEKFGISYPQVIDKTQALCERYGITGIPHIILFGPDGEIISEDLRGQQIAEAVSAYLN